MIQKVLPYAALLLSFACSGGKDVGTLDTETPTPDADGDTDADSDTDTGRHSSIRESGG